MCQLKALSFFLLFYCFGILVEGSQINAAITEFEVLLQRIELLENRNEEMEKQINKILKKSEMKDLRFTNRISELKRQNSLLRKSIEKDCNCFTVTNEHDEMNGHHNTSKPQKNDGIIKPEMDKKKTYARVHNQWGSADQKKRSGNVGMMQNRAVPKREVAFSATVTKHDVEHLGEQQNIVFDEAAINKGNAYHSRHGLFTAPFDGTYVICATVAGMHFNGDYYAHIDINGNSVAKLITKPSEQSSQMIIVELRAGDDVSIRNDNADDHILGDTYSTFSGFLLYQNDLRNK